MKSQLSLQAISQNTYQCLFKIFSNKDLLVFTDFSTCTNESDLNTVINYLQSPNRITYIIQNNTSKEYIGLVSATINAKHKTATISFITLPEFQQKRYTKQSLLLFIQKLCNDCNIIRIEAQVYIHNYASIGVLESIGFEKEGCLRKNFMIQGKLEDSYIFSLLNE